jgi:hypothetical protein
MNSKTIGRVSGAALLVQVIVAAVVYARLIVPGVGPDFLTTAAPHETQIRVGLLLLYGAWAMTMTVAVVTLPLFRAHSERLALLYLGLAVASGATLAAEIVAGRDMVALSVEYARATAPDASFELLGILSRRHRAAAHFANIAIAHAGVLVLWIILLRARLVPRLLAGFGVVAEVIALSAILASHAGVPFRFVFLQPVAVSMLLLILWLLWKGFAERPAATTATA